MRLAGIVLAAGSSVRMGRAKALVTVDGETFLERVVETASRARLSPLRVVVGEHGPAIAARLPGLRPILRRNPSPKEGQLSSLLVALGDVEDEGVDAAVVFLVDHPLVSLATVRALVEAFAATGKPIVVPSFRGRRGHPVVFGREVFSELADAPPSVGARAVVGADPGRVAEVTVEDPGILVDVDTPEDLARIGEVGP